MDQRSGCESQRASMSTAFNWKLRRYYRVTPHARWSAYHRLADHQQRSWRPRRSPDCSGSSLQMHLQEYLLNTGATSVLVRAGSVAFRPQALPCQPLFPGWSANHRGWSRDNESVGRSKGRVWSHSTRGIASGVSSLYGQQGSDVTM